MSDDPTATPEPAPAPPPSEPSSERRLRRSRTDRMIAGVAGGLADYLGIDPVLVRVGLVALVLLGFGAGVILYIVLVVVVPEETEAQAATKGQSQRSIDVTPEAARWIIGGLLIVVGALWLVRLFVPFLFELQVLAPLVLIAVGVAILAQSLSR